MLLAVVLQMQTLVAAVLSGCLSALAVQFLVKFDSVKVIHCSTDP